MQLTNASRPPLIRMNSPTDHHVRPDKRNVVPNPEMLVSNKTFADEQLALYRTKRQGAYTICGNSGNTVSFLPLPVATANFRSIIGTAMSQFVKAFYPADVDPSITAGYERQRQLLFDLYATTDTAVLETGFNGGTTFPLTLLKPFSRGTVLINTTDPLQPPRIDWGAFTNPVDVETMVAAVRKQRDLVATAAMREIDPVEVAPGANLTSDEQLRAALRQQAVPTYSHLSSTCSMMKREYGGVVGPGLKVYGVERLSVVDASIMPLIPSTHLSATVYAVAEKVISSVYFFFFLQYCRELNTPSRIQLTRSHTRRPISSKLGIAFSPTIFLGGPFCVFSVIML